MVSTSTHLKILNKAPALNKCPLKVSLIGVVGEVPKFKNEEDAIIKVSITDYSRRNYNFIVTMEFIENVLYVFGQDVNLVDTRFDSKKREYDNHNEMPLASTNSARSKLLSVHKNICKDIGSEEIYKRVKVEEMDENAEDIYIGCKKGNKNGVRTVIHNTRKSSKSKIDLNNDGSE
ncbi:13948_t:CDS:2 [Gigaspora rosea]|nr:13948_t:CDS:2 [Gigaspora rosea]